MKVEPGKYIHYKGLEVEVIGEAKHSETQEEMVVYQHDGVIWVRPKEMFLAEVEVDGVMMPRFKKISNK